MAVPAFDIVRMDNYGIKFDPRTKRPKGDKSKEWWVTCYEFEFYIDDWEDGIIIDRQLYPAKKDWYLLQDAEIRLQQETLQYSEEELQYRELFRIKTAVTFFRFLKMKTACRKSSRDMMTDLQFSRFGKVPHDDIFVADIRYPDRSRRQISRRRRKDNCGCQQCG